jgi:uncharacterized membrane protein YobD (UPF0266 family)
MKTSSIVLLIIGVFLLINQFIAYKGADFQFPPLYNGPDFVTTLLINAGSISGYNFMGLLGLIFIIIALTRKSKTK